MPRTRKEKAAELLARVQQGPAFSDIFSPNGPYSFTLKEAQRQYRGWAAWVIPLVLELVPELRRKEVACHSKSGNAR